MRRRVTIDEAADAAEEIASFLLGVNVAKAIDPTTPEGFLVLSNALQARLAKAAAGAEQKVVKEVFRELDLDWATMSEKKLMAALTAAAEAIEKSYATRVIPRIDSILKDQMPDVMKTSRAATIAREKLSIEPGPSLRDKDAEKWIRRSHVNFIRYSTGERAKTLSKQARSIVARALAQGQTTKQISETLKDQFGRKIPRPDSYWHVVAESFVGRGRVASQISALEDASIERYELVAVIDEVTTDICRAMDGKVFLVSKARELFDSLADLDDPEDVKYANPWVRKGIDDEGSDYLWVPRADGTRATIAKITRSGVGTADDRGEYSGMRSEDELAALGIPVPPFHGRCRTTIVAA